MLKRAVLCAILSLSYFMVVRHHMQCYIKVELPPRSITEDRMLHIWIQFCTKNSLSLQITLHLQFLQLINMLEKLTTNNIRVVYIPTRCIGELQPLDLTTL